MSNLSVIIEERPADIGHFLVGRLLPFRDKRMVGPFVFIDHMGPAKLAPGENLDIGPHPHIGLSTLTFLFEGAVFHRDSLGSAVEIRPGQVNWMTAGKGVVHSERTPDHLREEAKTLHGLQIWVALPKELEHMDPAFFHLDADELPAWEEDGLSFKLVAGNLMGHTSPVPVYSPLYMLEIKSKQRQEVHLGDHLYGEAGLYILEGSMESEEHTFGPRQILVAKNARLCHFTIGPETTLYLFGGEPFPEGRYIYWNFVASEPEDIEKAKEDWRDNRFPPMEGEHDPVPLPPNAFDIKLKK
ncbi:pirin family protein [Siphonobacter aquaeclarae]|uniref:Pirin n=1 Tax=Siphonobacter aquaeclarae TaxID=563176 RepID=A0A1G9HJF1_9BACT|nr:pirin family protein [Siphonobacter aquaeclarae]SDL13077.1 hypothetical protein SAMN04488090_0087 [Siphonobacter aquaeclarae]